MLTYNQAVRFNWVLGLMWWTRVWKFQRLNHREKNCYCLQLLICYRLSLLSLLSLFYSITIIIVTSLDYNCGLLLLLSS